MPLRTAFEGRRGVSGSPTRETEGPGRDNGEVFWVDGASIGIQSDIAESSILKITPISHC